MGATHPLREPNVFVVAPHPDDDAIGCGGTLARLAERGARVDVIYMTDGSRSHRSQRFPPPALRAIRESEAREALRCLGVDREPTFFGIGDGTVGTLGRIARETVVSDLARRIDASKADVIFAPWLRDPHPDHRASSALVLDAIARASHAPELWFYAVWLEIRGDASAHVRPGEAVAHTMTLDRTELARKRRAILAHRSQTTDLIDDDPAGFRIDSAMLDIWLAPIERFYRPTLG